MRTLSMPRNLYYGWYIVYALAITETVSYGVLYYAFSVFITPMEADFGWSRAEVTGALSLATLISGILAIPVGYWLDKHGARALMTVGSLGASILVFAWAQTDNLLMFYVIWALIGVMMSAVLYEPAFVVAAKWFENRRGQAMTIITFAAGFASTIFLPLTEWLNRNYGRQDAIMILGAILLICTAPLHGFILRRRPQDLGLEPDGTPPPSASESDTETSPIRIKNISVSMGKAVRSQTFWWLTLAFSFSSLSALAIRTHFYPYLIDNGYDSSFAAGLGGAIGVMQVAGRVLFAPLDARYSGRTLSIGIFALLGISLMILYTIQSTFGVILFVIVFGMAFGAVTLVRPVIIAQYYGSAQYGRISSVMATFLTFAGTIAPFGAGVLYDGFQQNYDPILIILFVLSMLAILAMLRAQPATSLTTT